MRRLRWRRCSCWWRSCRMCGRRRCGGVWGLSGSAWGISASCVGSRLIGSAGWCTSQPGRRGGACSSLCWRGVISGRVSGMPGPRRRAGMRLPGCCLGCVCIVIPARVYAACAVAWYRAAWGEGAGNRRVGHSKTFHSLRVTVVTMLHANGVSQGMAMELVGHDSSEVHAVYLRPSPDQLREAAGRLTIDDLRKSSAFCGAFLYIPFKYAISSSLSARTAPRSIPPIFNLPMLMRFKNSTVLPIHSNIRLT